MAEPRRQQRQHQLERFRRYLRQRLAETGVPMRRLARAMGRDPAYIAQLLDPPPGRRRALPAPDELRRAAPVLGVPLLELLEVAYGITRADLDLDDGAAEGDEWAAALEGLTSGQREQVRAFAAFLKAQGRAGMAANATGATDDHG